MANNQKFNTCTNISSQETGGSLAYGLVGRDGMQRHRSTVHTTVHTTCYEWTPTSHFYLRKGTIELQSRLKLVLDGRTNLKFSTVLCSTVLEGYCTGYSTVVYVSKQRLGGFRSVSVCPKKDREVDSYSGIWLPPRELVTASPQVNRYPSLSVEGQVGVVKKEMAWTEQQKMIEVVEIKHHDKGSSQHTLTSLNLHSWSTNNLVIASIANSMLFHSGEDDNLRWSRSSFVLV